MNKNASTDTLFLFTQAEQLVNLHASLLGKITTDASSEGRGKILYLHSDCVLCSVSDDYLALICPTNHPQHAEFLTVLSIPIITVKSDVIFTDGDVITVSEKGRIHRNFRVSSKNNAFLVTEACNNYCIMCPQPPKPVKENTPGLQAEKINRVLNLLSPEEYPDTLCLTGGEPTMLGGELVDIVGNIAGKMPYTLIHLLTNGRSFYYQDYVKQLSRAANGNLLVGVPLFAHVAEIHDYVVQQKGAFEQTVAGLLHCYKYGIPVELRVVLHKQTIPYLVQLAEFITRNLFFVKHVALMGMENMGFAKLNRGELYIDPVNYKSELSQAVEILNLYGIDTRIFNLPLCVVNDDVHDNCTQSISDFKNIYYPACDDCTKKEKCCGFFSSSTEKFLLTQSLTPFS